jgi:hypothetical protein
MVFAPYDVTVEDGLRLIGAEPFEGSDLPPNALAGDEAPAPDDPRPFLGLHNLVRELVMVGCYTCEGVLTPENAHTDCPGEPDRAAPELRQGNVLDLSSVGRNDPCPCGSGEKFKRCHGR